MSWDVLRNDIYPAIEALTIKCAGILNLYKWVVAKTNFKTLPRKYGKYEVLIWDKLNHKLCF